LTRKTIKFTAKNYSIKKQNNLLNIKTLTLKNQQFYLYGKIVATPVLK